MNQHLASFVHDFNSKFQALIKDKISNSTEFSSTDYYNQAVAQTEKLALSGKRIRPYITNLTLLTIESTLSQDQGIAKPIENLLFGIELFHLFALIHDDICDQAKTRRGVDCINTFLINNYSFPKHEADSLAMLIGDLVLTWSTEEVTLYNSKSVQQTYFQMIRELVYGESIDVAQAVLPAVSDKEVLVKTSYKSAKYTFQHPLMLGFAFHGSDPNKLVVEGIHEIGMAFQIQDDYLDITRLQAETGKPEMNDLQEGQQTFFSNYLLQHEQILYRDWLNNNRGQELDPKQIVNARQIFAESGALSAGKIEFESRYKSGLQKLLNGFEQNFDNLNNEYRSHWTNLIGDLMGRSN